MCSIDGGSSVYREITRKARKVHRCDECDHAIPVGVTYVYCSGLDDDSGQWWDGRTHVECNELWMHIWRDLCGRHGVRMLGGLEDEIGEHESSPVIELDHGAEMPAPLHAALAAIRAKYPRMEEVRV